MAETPSAGAREWTGLAVIALPCVLYATDLTVLNLAVPALSADLRPSSAQPLWIVDVYGFLVAGSLVVMGALGDRIGRRGSYCSSTSPRRREVAARHPAPGRPRRRVPARVTFGNTAPASAAEKLVVVRQPLLAEPGDANQLSMRAVGASTPAPRSSEGRDAWSLFAEVWADGHGLIDLLYGHRFRSPWPAAETLMTPCSPTWASPDQRAGAAGAEPVVASRRRRPPPGYDRRVRRDEIVEVVEVKPLTVADVPADDPERTAAQPPSRPQPLRA